MTTEELKALIQQTAGAAVGAANRDATEAKRRADAEAERLKRLTPAERFAEGLRDNLAALNGQGVDGAGRPAPDPLQDLTPGQAAFARAMTMPA